MSHAGSRFHKAIPSRVWSRIRYAVLSRDHWQCTRCKKFGRLEVHHVKPLCENGTNDLENLSTLCYGCHKLHHNDGGFNPERHQWRKLTKTLIEASV